MEHNNDNYDPRLEVERTEISWMLLRVISHVSMAHDNIIDVDHGNLNRALAHYSLALEELTRAKDKHVAELGGAQLELPGTNTERYGADAFRGD